MTASAPAGVVVRPSTAADLPAIAALWNRAIGDRYPIDAEVLATVLERNPSRRRGDSLVASVGDDLIGFAYLTIQRLPDPELAAEREAAHLQAVVVDAGWRRQGLGRRLTEQLLSSAAREGRTRIEAGSGFFYLWPGVPTDLDDGEPFVRAIGLEPGSLSFDLRGDVSGIVVGPAERAALARAELSVGRLLPDEADALLRYLLVEFGAEWWHDIRWALDEGLDPAAIVVLRTADGSLVGHARIHRPADRPLGPPLFWRARRGSGAGGLGPIGVARRFRGQGLGRALLVAALAELRSEGATDVVIDFTTLLDFYGPVGFRPWMTFRHAGAPTARVRAALARGASPDSAR
ncbi:MAG TPA: GNAT family N-acetyltransferase [Candidatus Limnocylindrales bacterium]|nr:GNAT family N-acetyltransferase [Candidatus Limnocylindrales bacterium]